MPMTQGLFSNIRLAEEQPKIELGPEQDIIDSSGQENADKSNFDDKGNLISIEHPDGSITISIDGKPLEGVKPRGPTGWFDNLVEDIDQGELNRIEPAPTADHIEVRVPKNFYNDHLARDCGDANNIVRELTKHYVLHLTSETYVDLYTDVECYIENGSEMGWEMQGLVSSARATRDALHKVTKPAEWET